MREEETAIRATIGSFEQRLEGAPEREQEFALITRDRQAAKDLYDSLLKRYDEAQLSASMETDRQGERFRILEPALPPEGPSAPNRLRLILMGLLLAIAAAVSVVLTAEQFDASFHGVDELREFTSVPVLVSIPPIGPMPLKRRLLTGLATISAIAMIPAHRARRLSSRGTHVMAHTHLDPHLVALTSPGSFAAEQYQGLRLTIERLRRGRTLQVIAVTSPAAGEGKTLTAINLAGALARGGDDARVLLMDADLRRPAVARQLAIEDSGRGLTEVIENANTPLDSVTQKLKPYNLSVVPAGTRNGAVHHILRSSRLDVVLAEARQRYDFVVLDTPPLLPVFDSALLANAVDGVLMVVAANQTPRKLLAEALNLLDPAKVLGIVFNRDARPMFGYYDAYYKDYFPEQMVTEA